MEPNCEFCGSPCIEMCCTPRCAFSAYMCRSNCISYASCKVHSDHPHTIKINEYNLLIKDKKEHIPLRVSNLNKISERIKTQI